MLKAMVSALHQKNRVGGYSAIGLLKKEQQRPCWEMYVWFPYSQGAFKFILSLCHSPSSLLPQPYCVTFERRVSVIQGFPLGDALERTVERRLPIEKSDLQNCRPGIRLREIGGNV
jgi:hypothetical protein